MTIRKRLTFWYAGLLILIIIVFSTGVFGIMRASMLNATDQLLEETATKVIQSIGVVPVGEFGPLTTQVDFRSEDVFRVPGASIQVWQTRDGQEVIRPILTRTSADIEDYPYPLDENHLNVDTVYYTNVIINDIPGRVTTRPFYVGDQQIGIVQVAMSVQTIQHSVERMLAVMLVASALAIICAMVLGMWLSGRVLRPIERITEAARSIADTEDLSTRLPWHGPMDELGQLTKVFNRMMGRLEHLFRVQQRFVGDVSHELRTPLTAIRGNLEMIERYGMDQLALEAIHSETDRMARMVNDLLLLARADYGEMTVDMYPLDLDTVVLESFEQAQLIAKDRELTFRLEPFNPVRVHGNTDRLRQLLSNLLNNAIKFTPDGGTITVSLTQENNQACLKVQDTGIGISPKNQALIFDRFFQVDDSRVHHSDSDGSGLGLSIVKWLVDVHQGTIAVNSVEGEGSTFTIHLPKTTSPSTAAPRQHYTNGQTPYKQADQHTQVSQKS